MLPERGRFETIEARYTGIRKSRLLPVIESRQSGWVSAIDNYVSKLFAVAVAGVAAFILVGSGTAIRPMAMSAVIRASAALP
jgi:hypothetical protein